MEKKLYQWQEECLEKWFASNCRGMVQAVTGSGKTLLALTAVNRLEQMTEHNLHVKIVVPTQNLMRQWNKALRNNFSTRKIPQKTIGLRGGGHNSPPNCKYMIYVINSARYELARQILAELQAGENVLLIADECHHYASGQNQLIFEFLPYIQACEKQFYSLGLSATLPSGQAGHYLASVLGRKIYSYGMAEASALHTICRYDIYHIELSFQMEERKEYQELSDRMTALYHRLLSAHPTLGRLEQRERYELLRELSGCRDRGIAEAASMYLRLSFKRKSLVCMASARLECANELILRLDSRDKILVFGERIRQTEELYQLLQNRYPGRVGRYHSKLGGQANRNTLERFQTGEIRILITCKAMDEGVDIPDASVGIILSGTSTQRQRIQRLGRIIRQKEGKNSASLYYLHIAETSEDACYLPDSKESRIFDLQYHPDTQTFSNPPYDRSASALLEQMSSSGMEKDKLQEAQHCLKLGCVRTDWLSEQSVLEARIQNARSNRDRNYWICMKKMRELF